VVFMSDAGNFDGADTMCRPGYRCDTAFVWRAPGRR
jgi:hypothetical protein